MVQTKLALLGGKKTIPYAFKKYNPIGEEERLAVDQVCRSGVLSQYLGCWHNDFYGGPKVRVFEQQCAEFFRVKHAVSVNSLTSGLIAAVGALGIEPGDEVIVSPWTMCATATAILHWNAIPVFADIEPDTFCLDPKSVEANLSPYTKAIISPDIFGQSADMEALLEIAKKHQLKVISDSAQAPAARYKESYAGTLADIGGYSLNYHKHIHTGEGGIMVTDDDNLAEKMRLIRNHAEAVVAGKKVDQLANMVGYNFRLGEIECAIGSAQLKKLRSLVATKQQCAEQFSHALKKLPGIKTPAVRKLCTHSYYIYPLIIDCNKLGIERELLLKALHAEGLEHLSAGYCNIHLLPMFQQKVAYGSRGFPWSSDICKREVSYSKGICPVAEKLHDETFLSFQICLVDLSSRDISLIVEAFYKVWESMAELKHKPTLLRGSQ